jgi:hypothetical protein
LGKEKKRATFTRRALPFPPCTFSRVATETLQAVVRLNFSNCLIKDKETANGIRIHLPAKQEASKS